MVVYKLACGALFCLVLAACGGSSSGFSNDSSSSRSSSSDSSSSGSSDNSSSSDSSSSESSSGQSGLVARPDNTQCLATRFRQPAAIGLERINPEQGFDEPVGFIPLPGSDDAFYVPQQNGVIWRLDRIGDSFSASLLVDMRDYSDVQFLPNGCHECGFYSLAFHPEFETNGYIYMSFTEGGQAGVQLVSHIARFHSSDGGLTLDYADEAQTTLLRDTIYSVEQPRSIHNNGHLAFGPDGYLYVAFGDGGPGGDPNSNSQNTNNPFGSFLRLTDEGDPAPGNLAGGLPEIYAYGLRNPWRWSFDRLTGDLWAGDVGQARVEELNIIVNGGNYGWRCYEGMEPYGACGSDGPFIDPVFDYAHVDGKSVTGGYVYRGTELPDLYGMYIYGDFVSGVIWGLVPDGEGQYSRVQLLVSGKMIVAFGEDHQGEIYLMDYINGGIYKVVATEDSELPPLPELLSETGCVDPFDPTQPAEALIPYDINEPFWSDNAQKERFVALPNDGQIEVASDGNFELPVGSILVKNFRLHGQMIETRLLLNQPDTGWSGYSYQWNEAQTEAALLTGSLSVPIEGQIWHYPSGGECSQCHTTAAGVSLGLEAAQLNKTFTYPTTGISANQLDTFESIGLFSASLDAAVRELAMPDSKDISEPLVARARSYLHSNCSHCHRPGGTTQSTMNLLYSTSPAFMNACDAPPLQSDLGIPDARLIVPGDYLSSILWHRLEEDGEHRMPPVGSNLLDLESADLIRDWILSLDGCETIVGPVGANYTIRNRWTQGYIHTENGSPEAGAIQADWLTAHWVIEPWNQYYRIRSRANPDHYLNVESLPLRSGPVNPEWWSADWEITPVGDYFRIRNRWRTNHYLHAEGAGGELQAGPIEMSWFSARWLFEQVD